MSSAISIPRVTKLRRRHRSSRKHQRSFSSTNTSRTNIITPTKTPTNDNKASCVNTSNIVKPSYSVIKVHRCQHSALETEDRKKCESAEWPIEQDISSQISSDMRKRASTTDKYEMSANVSNAKLPNDQSRISFSVWSRRKLSSGNMYDTIERKKRHKRQCGFHCCCSPACLCLCVVAGLLIAIAITALLVGLLMKSNTTSTSTSTTTTSTSRSSVFDFNLLVNGDGETGPCDTNGNVTQPTGWNYNGTISQIHYNSSVTSGQTFTTPGPSDRGQCYFTGETSASTSMWQIIDLSNYVDSFFIDSQVVNYNLSAWLGGYTNQNDNVRVSLIFADQSNQAIGNGIIIGPVLAIDRVDQTSLLFRQTNGLVPVGARFLTVLVTITRSSGTRNNGDLDNIVVVLY